MIFPSCCRPQQEYEIPLADLKPNDIEDRDLERLPRMTGWFAPVLLLKLLLRVVVSDLFGQYADRRLIEAALDPATPDELVDRAEAYSLIPDTEGAVWIDYVSDLGDGFDATYAIALSLAEQKLEVEGQRTERGAMLVMGGDQIYPTATREDYRIKFRLPYSLAWPVHKDKAATPLYALPGNHDWYDGLVNFLALFGRANGTAIGGWKTYQRRSYFAVKLTDKWWLWGIDIALVKDMDQPQADYFETIVARMPENANIILSSAEPSWYTAESQSDSYKSLSYAALLAKRSNKNFRIPLILSGDTHHYARYLGDGSHYITSGGGGAFLHGTLELKPIIEAKWLQSASEQLHLQSCYPTKEKSKALLAGNLNFGKLNKGLARVIAAAYVFATFVALNLPLLDSALLILALFIGVLWGYSKYQEKSWAKTAKPSILHGLVHAGVVALFATVGYWAHEHVAHWLDWWWVLQLIILLLVVGMVGTPLAGFIFGWSLRLGCERYGISHNDAFSAMQLDTHRHFLRLKIKDQSVTVYPIKLETPPARNSWKRNPLWQRDNGQPVFVPENPLKREFIEKPFVVNAREASSTSEIKPPSEGSKVET